MFKRVVRIVEQDVTFANGVKPVAEFIKPEMAQARQRLVHQVGFANVREANKVFKVVVTATGYDGVIARNGQFLAQHLHHGVRHIALVNKADRLGRQALFQAGGHQLHQAGFHLVDQVVFGVTGHLHRVGV